jgi:desulfoferrodoxin (superoxide reductase-like protein)
MEEKHFIGWIEVRGGNNVSIDPPSSFFRFFLLLEK